MVTSQIFLLICLCFISINCQDQLEDTIKNLFKLLKPVPPKGNAFPKIPGPNPKDQVCIVGAGPSGIHMALSLKKKGYSKVTIYEKTNRVGGKAYDINYRGVAHAQGAIFLTPSYFDTVVPLAKEYGVGDLVELPPVNVWKTTSAMDVGSKLTGSQFIIGSISRITNETSPQKNLGILLGAVTKYIQIHKELFGSYQGALMWKPSPEVFSRISGTFLEFLKKENLLVLVPVLTVTQTVQGYGQLDEISALYGLMWNQPRFMIATILNKIGGAKDPFKIYFFKNGFEVIWKTIAEVENLDIRFNIDLHSVNRRSGHHVDLRFWKGSYLQKQVCDFLIWTAPMSSLLRTLSDATHQEYSLLGSLKPTIFTANLVNMKNEARNGPYTMHYQNLHGKVDHGVTVEAGVMGMLEPNIKSPEGLETYNQDNGNVKTCSILQMGKEYSNEKDLNDELVRHYKEGFNATDIEILSTISWSYFPRWNPEEANQGRHWKVFDMQGLNNMWYAGSSVSFESVNDVLEYNNLLIRQMMTSTATTPKRKLYKWRVHGK